MIQEFNKNKLSYSYTGSPEPLIWATIGQRLRLAAEKYPNNDALVAVWKNERYSYEHFFKICRRAAKGLMRMGVKKGDRVGILATNYTEWVITQF